jgi:serine phosphatase RsbU (regulator of sigma subunit)
MQFLDVCGQKHGGIVRPERVTRITLFKESCTDSELEAARVVQQVLIPEKIPAIPGFAIASVHKPASLVGGDFFQIITTSQGGVLVVIGDVSGKGMPAAMTVSLLARLPLFAAYFSKDPIFLTRS